MKSELKHCTVECRGERDAASAGELDAKLDSVFDAGSSDLANTWCSRGSKNCNHSVARDVQPRGMLTLNDTIASCTFVFVFLVL